MQQRTTEHLQTSFEMLQKLIWKSHSKVRFNTHKVSRSPNEARKETPYSDRSRIIHEDTELSTERIDRTTGDSAQITGLVAGDRMMSVTCRFNPP